ncbi:porin [Piscinibacter sp. XHJ-5]|uniref:porin n=1 Tax=Piscinibacter sp. XHJ-5 TaxID=3037797 RepID=UPI002453070C|nr:porin [Piscinibacter sp. XHJ-5]
MNGPYRVLLGVIASAGIGAADAQSSVVLYGLLDASVRVVDDVGGSRLVTQGSGDQQGSRWGLRGVEDIGHGVRAVFQLESGFGVDTGTLAQGGLMWGRQAFVGLASPYGTVTAGRQYDFMVELGAFHAVQAGTGTLDWNIGDNDRVAGQRLDNSIKYSHQRGALGFGALYGFGERPGSASQASGHSFMVRYSGDTVSMGAAATRVRDRSITPFPALGIGSFLGVATLTGAGAAVQVPLSRIDNIGFGASYKISRATLLGLYTETRMHGADRQEKLRNWHIGTRFAATPSAVLVLSLSESWLGVASWNRGALAADYSLSKRTDLYVAAIHTEASEPAVKAVLFTVAPAAGSRQRALVAGVRHRF